MGDDAKLLQKLGDETTISSHIHTLKQRYGDDSSVVKEIRNAIGTGFVVSGKCVKGEAERGIRN